MVVLWSALGAVGSAAPVGSSAIPRTIPFIVGTSSDPVTPPTVPTGLTAAARSGGAQVSWTAPAGVTDYTLVATGASVSRRYSFSVGSPVAIRGLVNGVVYTLTLVARNAAGSSPGATVTVTPSGAAIFPGSDGTTLVSPAPIAPAPPVITAVTPYDGAAVVTWSPPADDGGSSVTGYALTVTTVADGTVVLTAQATAGDTSALLAPLQNATQYAVSIVASNGVGFSQPSDPGLVTPVGGQPYIPPDPVDGPTVHVTVPQPMWTAFPVDRVFHPENWLLTAEEADAL